MLPIRTFDDREELVLKFLVAAQASSVRSALQVLFIHGSDLSAGDRAIGMYLAEVLGNQNVRRRRQVAHVRAKLHFVSAVRYFLSEVPGAALDDLAELVHKTQGMSAEERQAAVGAKTRDLSERHAAIFEKTAPLLFEALIPAAEAFASWISSAAADLRKRQLAMTGLSTSDYDAMITALRAIDVLGQPSLVAQLADSCAAVTIGSADVRRARHQATMALYRLPAWLKDLKSGSDVALPLFVASFVNANHIGRRCAFAGARQGDPSSPEFDVAIPDLKTAFEMKLFQAPFSVTETKIAAISKELTAQLQSYIDAGFERVFLVTNLRPRFTQSLLTQVRRRRPAVAEHVKPISGPSELIRVLRGVGDELDGARMDEFVRRIEAVGQRRASDDLPAETNTPQGDQ